MAEAAASDAIGVAEEKDDADAALIAVLRQVPGASWRSIRRAAAPRRGSPATFALCAAIRRGLLLSGGALARGAVFDALRGRVQSESDAALAAAAALPLFAAAAAEGAR